MSKHLVTMAASAATATLLLRTLLHDYLPEELQAYIRATAASLLPASPLLTVAIEETEDFVPNQMYESAAIYLGGMVSKATRQVRVWKKDGGGKMAVTVDRGEEVVDVFEGVEMRWRLAAREGVPRREKEVPPEIRVFELGFHRKYKEVVLEKYLPFVMERAMAIKEENRAIKLFMVRYTRWSSATLEHPATFDTVALDPELKLAVMTDLEKFVKRKDYYKRVGKAWKRGYLLYGPPGTGKSSLVAAMANFLKFDVYDLELADVDDNCTLRSLLIATTNRSIIVVEDIDCTIELKSREIEDNKNNNNADYDDDSDRLTLSGLLNAMDGLWSCCGEERIIVFTTNHKDRLDPALLRPGRMDMHVHMSYCTPPVFRVLVKNYHCVEDHGMFQEIERLMMEVEVTPAEVAGELMKSDDVEVALGCVVKFLEEKREVKGEEAGDGNPVTQVDKKS